MDVSIIETYFDDNVDYLDTNKAFFIEILNVLFTSLKESGDTFLTPYSGYCNGESCENFCKNGYTFIGNKTNKQISFVFELEDSTIKSFVSCYDFEKYDKQQIKTNEVLIIVGVDQKPDFTTTAAYAIMNEKCIKALDEILQFKDIYIDSSIYLPWLEKHYYLEEAHEEFIGIFKNITDATRLFFHFNRLKTIIEKNDIIKNALHLLSDFETKTEDEKHMIFYNIRELNEYANEIFLIDENEEDYKNVNYYLYQHFIEIKISNYEFEDLNKLKLLYYKYSDYIYEEFLDDKNTYEVDDEDDDN